jgi:hypothetical protein
VGIFSVYVWLVIPSIRLCLSPSSCASTKRRRFDSSIGKPSIFSHIPLILPFPTCFPGDLMHQPLINLAALLLDLWCVRPEARDYDWTTAWPCAVLTSNIWVQHGKAVASAFTFLPTLFGRVEAQDEGERQSCIDGINTTIYYTKIPTVT